MAREIIHILLPEAEANEERVGSIFPVYCGVLVPPTVTMTYNTIDGSGVSLTRLNRLYRLNKRTAWYFRNYLCDICLMMVFANGIIPFEEWEDTCITARLSPIRKEGS